MTDTVRLTVAQALVRFLAAQAVERDGARSRFFARRYGVFGHGNVAGLGQALQQHTELLPFHQGRTPPIVHSLPATRASATGSARSSAPRRSGRARRT